MIVNILDTNCKICDKDSTGYYIPLIEKVWTNFDTEEASEENHHICLKCLMKLIVDILDIIDYYDNEEDKKFIEDERREND